MPLFRRGIYTFWETVSKHVCVFQHTGKWRWPWCLRAPSLCEGLLLCSGGPSTGDSSDAAQRHSRQRKLCLLVPPWAQDSHGWDWTYGPEDSLPKNQWWSCQRICKVEIWVPLHRGRHLSCVMFPFLFCLVPVCASVQQFSFINYRSFFMLSLSAPIAHLCCAGNKSVNLMWIIYFLVAG